MHVKTAGAEMKGLLTASHDEQQDNIKRAQRNARCTDPNKLVPYNNKAAKDLIRGVDALIGLAHGGGDS